MEASRMSQEEINHVDRLIFLFDQTFSTSHQTVLVRGEKEPLYRPKTKTQTQHQIVFAHGFFASALHEISHWCLAGAERRKLLDYGYWYLPVRNDKEQEAFFHVEIKPQALEWALTLAAGRHFFISADNLQPGGSEPSANWSVFTSQVRQQTLEFLTGPLPKRAGIFASALFLEFHPYAQNLRGPQTEKLKETLESWKSKALQDFLSLEDKALTKFLNGAVERT